MKISLYYCDIEDSCTNTSILAAQLSDHEREQAARYRSDADRLRFCAGRVLLRNVLAAHMACPAGAIRIRSRARGKPFVAGGPSFNLSHSHSMVLLGVAVGGDIGVDVEHVRELNDLHRLAHSCFSDREVREFARYKGHEATLAFFRAWTRKEAIVKALGSGLSVDLKSFSVSTDIETTNALIEFDSADSADAPWSVVPVMLPGDYEAAVAANIRVTDIEVQKADSLPGVCGRPFAPVRRKAIPDRRAPEKIIAGERFCGADHSAESARSVR